MPVPSYTLYSPCCGTGAPWLGALGQCGKCLQSAVGGGVRRRGAEPGEQEVQRRRAGRRTAETCSRFFLSMPISFLMLEITGKLIPSELQLTYFKILSLKFNVQIKRLIKFMFCFKKQKTRLVEVTHPPRWNTTLPSAHFCNPFGLSEAEWWCKSHVANHQTSGRPSWNCRNCSYVVF